MRRLFNRLMIGRDLAQWRERHSLTATDILHEMAAKLIVLGEREAASLDPVTRSYRQSDFLAERIKILVRDAAEPMADLLLEAANRDLALLADAEAVRVRADTYAVPAPGLMGDLGQMLMTSALPLNRTAALHARIGDYVRGAVIAGSKTRPAVLEQLHSAYAEAVARALRR